MASGKLLRQLIKSGAEGNHDAFRQISEEVIREERAKNHHLLANDLEKILYGRPTTLQRFPFKLSDNLPKDKEHGIPLLHVKEPVRALEDVVLSDENSSLLEEILLELHKTEVLKSYGLNPIDKLLFYGPPGCGKTLTSEVIAGELGLPLAVVRIDSVILGKQPQTSDKFSILLLQSLWWSSLMSLMHWEKSAMTLPSMVNSSVW